MNDELVSIAHLLLNELEASQSVWESLSEPDWEEKMDEQYADNQSVIDHAKEVLSKYPI